MLVGLDPAAVPGEVRLKDPYEIRGPFHLYKRSALEKAIRRAPKGRGNKKVYHALALEQKDGLMVGRWRKVELENGTLNHLATFAPFFTKLALGIGRDIFVHATHGEAASPVEEEGTLHVFPFASPAASTVRRYLALGSEPLAEEEPIDFLTPSFVGQVMGVGDVALAEWLGNSLYILWDFFHLPATPATLAHLQKVFDGTLVRIAAVAADLSPLAPVLTAVVTKRQTEARRDVKNLENEMAQLHQRCVVAYQEMGALQVLLAGAAGATEERVERMMAEVRGLVRLPGVTTVFLEGNDLLVRTTEFVLGFEEMRKRVGPFTVRISQRGVSIKGPDTTNAEAYPHPHIQPSGHVCWGNLADSVPKLLGSGEYSALMTVILSFLGSYNPSDAYRRLDSVGTPIPAETPVGPGLALGRPGLDLTHNYMVETVEGVAHEECSVGGADPADPA